MELSDYVPINMYPENWECELCEEKTLLVWALGFGNCFCENCKAPYTFYPNGVWFPLSRFPIYLVKNEYRQAIKQVYDKELELGSSLEEEVTFITLEYEDIEAAYAALNPEE